MEKACVIIQLLTELCLVCMCVCVCLCNYVHFKDMWTVGLLDKTACFWPNDKMLYNYIF